MAGCRRTDGVAGVREGLRRSGLLLLLAIRGGHPPADSRGPQQGPASDAGRGAYRHRAYA